MHKGADGLSADEIRAYPVLFVDDNIESVALFASRFEETFSLLTATSPSQALRILANEPVAVLLTDYRMPGMSGIDLCEQVKVRWPRVARAVLTGYADRDMAVDAINRGEIHRMLTRPVSDHELLQLLHDLVGRAHLRQTVETLQQEMLERERDVYFAYARGAIIHDLAGVSNGLSLSCHSLTETLDAVWSLLPMDAVHDVREHLHAMGLFIQHISDLHGQARELTGATHSKRGPHDVRELVGCAIELVRREPGTDVAFEVSCRDAEVVHVDHVDVSRILLNLFRNARQALADVRTPTLQIDVVRAGLEVEIRVADNGPGIPAHQTSQVFELSWSTRVREGGQGYGLYLSRALAQANDGELTVQRSAMGGAEFILSLPSQSKVELGLLDGPFVGVEVEVGDESEG